MTDQTVITLRSLTVSIKAQRLLSEHGIFAKTVKLTQGDGNGCKYGVSISKEDAPISTEILTKNGVVPDP